ncbi:Galactose oxidase [Zostera marina]|uniref:Galactose oxidase n=1 Tax=Zostera marina TaxID=29655 RepID=A0A0K9NSE4_ZOSMR|nr:Galactose oxidase [Zostera marina]
MVIIIFLFIVVSINIDPIQSEMPNPNNITGTWKLLQSSIGISAMHVQLLHTNQLVIFDRTDFGISNLSLATGTPCRNDPNDTAIKIDCSAHSLLYNIESNTLRPLDVQTDTWCSSGAVLPNGTMFQSGGFNDGEKVVRFYSPETKDSDWVEVPTYLKVRRWYATNQILPDGDVIIIGGRKAFSYEFFPTRIGNDGGLYEFAFLRDTNDVKDENNLYPFVHLLPDGKLYIFANTKGIIFDHNRNVVVRKLPSLPGEDPRNYPSTGSSVLLPLKLHKDGPRPSNPDKLPAEVLMCGGAPANSHQKARNGTFLKAVQTCGRLVVTDPNAKWEMETMPAPRVMSDMVILPTGDIIIINGAMAGTAGWELGREPMRTPVLYRPNSQPEQRFQELTSTEIPRMYHSTAVLDTYGRIIVGGSNPHVYYNFTQVLYPTELSLEAFYPPYMDWRFDNHRPYISLMGPGNVLTYGQHLWIQFEVIEYKTNEEPQVAIIAPSFTTHSQGMNQRMVLLAVDNVSFVGPSTYQIDTNVPKTPRIAPPGYYMLFVVHDGVPGMGTWIQIQKPS